MHQAKLTFRIFGAFEERSVTAYFTDEDLDPTEHVRGKMPDVTAEQLMTLILAERHGRFAAAVDSAISGLEEPALSVIRDQIAKDGNVKLVFNFDDGPLQQMFALLSPKEEQELSEADNPEAARAKWIDEVARASMLTIRKWFSIQARAKFGLP
jgi:hypothetical protein